MNHIVVIPMNLNAISNLSKQQFGIFMFFCTISYLRPWPNNLSSDFSVTCFWTVTFFYLRCAEAIIHNFRPPLYFISLHFCLHWKTHWCLRFPTRWGVCVWWKCVSALCFNLCHRCPEYLSYHPLCYSEWCQCSPGLSKPVFHMVSSGILNLSQ